MWNKVKNSSGTSKTSIFNLALISLTFALSSLSFGSMLRVDLTVSSDDLYGEKGIFSNPKESGKEWEVQAGITIKDQTGSYLLPLKTVGLRIHGGASRKRGAKKSLKIYFKKKYGTSKLGVDLFGNGETELKKLIFRAGFNDSWNYDRDRGRNGQKRLATYLKDQIARDMHKEMGHDSLAGVWSVIYINGSYQGLYNIVKALDEDNFKSDTLDEDIIGVVSSDEIKNGDASEWQAMVSSVMQNDPSSEDYLEKVSQHLDVENFASYIVLNTWLQNYDWPKHNWKALKLGPDAKWKFYIWDAEYAFGSGASGYNRSFNIFDDIKKQAEDTKSALPKIAYKLSQNHSFVLLMKYIFDKNKSIFNKSSLERSLSVYATLLSPYIEKEATLLKLDYSRDVWVRALRKMLEFTEKRSEIYAKQLESLSVKPLKSSENLSDNIVLCKSVEFNRASCGDAIKSATLIERLSSAKCREGREWSLSNGVITVDKGCRAYFRVIK